MEVSYNCEITAEIEFLGKFWSVSSLCPVYNDKQLTVFDEGQKYVVPFVDGISRKVSVKLSHYFPSKARITVSAKKVDYDCYTTDCMVDSIVSDMIKDFIHYLIYEDTRNYNGCK